MSALVTSPHGRALLGSLRRTFELLVEHQKHHPEEVSEIALVLAAHLRSWHPMAATSIPGTPRDNPVHIGNGVQSCDARLGERSFYDIARCDDQRVSLYVMDESGKDAAVVLTRGQAETLREDLRKVTR